MTPAESIDWIVAKRRELDEQQAQREMAKAHYETIARTMHDCMEICSVYSAASAWLLAPLARLPRKQP